MEEQHNSHYIDRGWFLILWHRDYRWQCSMRLALMLLVYVSGALV